MQSKVEPTQVGYDIVITGVKPIPKQRPRFGQGRVFTPAATRTYEDILGWRFRQAAKAPLLGPIRVAINFETSSRADVDNLAKAVLDAGNGILYRDDSQVVSLVISKVKSANEVIHVVLEEL